MAEDREPARWLYLLHGVFGAGRNWASVARRLVRACPEWGAVLVDLRQHGASQGFAPPHGLQRAAADLAALANGTGRSATAVLGHSLGGKVALVFARDHGRDLESVWVVDSTPAATEPGGSAWDMLRILRRLPGRFVSRPGAIRALEAKGVAPRVAQWMGTNLEPVPDSEDAYRWRFDLDAIEELMQDFFRTDLWPLVDDPPGDFGLHFIKAEESNVVTETAATRLEAAARRTGRVRLHRLEGGHWLNADNPDGVVELLTREL